MSTYRIWYKDFTYAEPKDRYIDIEMFNLAYFSQSLPVKAPDFYKELERRKYSIFKIEEVTSE